MHRCSVWYRPLSHWPFSAEAERQISLSACALKGHLLRVTIPGTASMQLAS
jgi:hypothetical protein